MLKKLAILSTLLGGLLLIVFIKNLYKEHQKNSCSEGLECFAMHCLEGSSNGSCSSWEYWCDNKKGTEYEESKLCPAKFKKYAFPQFDFSEEVNLRTTCFGNNSFACDVNNTLLGEQLLSLSKIDFCKGQLGKIGYEIAMQDASGQTVIISIMNYKMSDFNERLHYVVTDSKGQTTYPCYSEGKRNLAEALKIGINGRD